MPYQPTQNSPMPPMPPAGGAPMPPQGAAPMPPMPPQGAAPEGAMPEEARGAQRVQNTEFNQQVQNIILSRIEEEGQKNPEWGDYIQEGMSPEAAQELGLILPELLPVFRAVGLLGDIGQPPQNIGAPAQQAQQPQGQGEQESDNPILRDGLSSGLVG